MFMYVAHRILICNVSPREQWGKRVKEIETGENSVTITFMDGSQETGNLVIGAEGAHSSTREFLLGSKEAELLQSPIVASVTITKLGREASIALRKLHPRYIISFHPNGTFTWHSSMYSQLSMLITRHLKRS